MKKTEDTTFTAVPASSFDALAATRFRDDGFCRMDDAIDADELPQLRDVYGWCFSCDADSKLARKALGGVDEQGRQALPQVIFPCKALTKLRHLGYRRRLEAIARSVFGEAVELRGEHTILKPARHGVATPWHQDQAYHDPSRQYRSINFWLPLEGATVEGGCMQFAADPGSSAMAPAVAAARPMIAALLPPVPVRERAVQRQAASSQRK